MKIPPSAYQTKDSAVYQTPALNEDPEIIDEKTENIQSETDQKASQKISENTDSLKISCSIPEDSTGQLAAMLARAETKIAVLDVSSKATRALNSLKMASALAEGDDAKKVAQMIRRMEKLINRIHKKQQHLNKEEMQPLQLVLRGILLSNQAFEGGSGAAEGVGGYAQQYADQIKFAVSSYLPYRFCVSIR